MPLSDCDPITLPVLATVADLVKHLQPSQATVRIDELGRMVRITCRNVDRHWLRALLAAGASGSRVRPTVEQLEGHRREALERAVLGGLKAAINDHGPITADMLTSAAKRIVGNLANAPETGPAFP